MKGTQILLLSLLFFSLVASAELTPGQEASLLEAIDPRVWGSFDANSYPWLNTMDFGWVYFEPLPGTGTFWMWNSDLGWMYSSKELFPEAYLSQGGFWAGLPGWVIFDQTDFRRHKFFVKSSKNWIILPRSDLDHPFPVTMPSRVPEDLNGLSSSWWIPRAGGRTSVGGTSLTVGYGDPHGSWTRTYYYNAADNWFYPWASFSELPVEPGTTFLNLNLSRRARIHREGNELVIEWQSLIHNEEPVIERLTID